MIYAKCPKCKKFKYIIGIGCEKCLKLKIKEKKQ